MDTVLCVRGGGQSDAVSKRECGILALQVQPLSAAKSSAAEAVGASFWSFRMQSSAATEAEGARQTCMK